MKYAQYALLIATVSAAPGDTCAADGAECGTDGVDLCNMQYEADGTATAGGADVCVASGDCAIALDSGTSKWMVCSDAAGAAPSTASADVIAAVAAAAEAAARATYAGLDAAIVLSDSTDCATDADCVADGAKFCVTQTIDVTAATAAALPTGWVMKKGCMAEAKCTEAAVTVATAGDAEGAVITNSCVAAGTGDGDGDSGTGDGDGDAGSSSTACDASTEAPCGDEEDQICVGLAWASMDDTVDGYVEMDDAAKEAGAGATTCMTEAECTAVDASVVDGNTFEMACGAMKNALALSAAAIALAATF